ncbi:MAG: tyrosine-type recombinase/integrase [Nitriliruptorales bacterium]
MLDGAVANRMLRFNVARGVALPRVGRAERHFLAAEQVDELAEAIGERYGALVYVLAYGGLRFGEAVALRRKRCELLRRRLRIEEAATEVGANLIWGSPKTHAVRSVSLPPFVVQELAHHLEAVEDTPDALVFTAPVSGGPLRNSDFRRYVWKPAVRAAGLPGALTPHELRHTAASLLIAQGANPKSIQAHLGHSTITTTFDLYGHLFEGHLDDVMGQLDAAHRSRGTAPRRPHDDDGEGAEVIEFDIGEAATGR